MRRPVIIAIAASLTMAPLGARAQNGNTNNAPRVLAALLRKHLFTIAADSMGGRDVGSKGNYLTAEYVAAQFKKAGLEPAGENGTYFQTVPFTHTYFDPASSVIAGGMLLRLGNDFMPVNRVDQSAAEAKVIYAGNIGDSTTWISPDQAASRFLVFAASHDMTARNAAAMSGNVFRNARFANAAGYAVAALDVIPVDTRAQRLQGQFSANTAANAAQRSAPMPPATKPMLLLTRDAATRLLRRDVTAAQPGDAGPVLSATITVRRDSLLYPARSVVGILRGSDPKLRNTYMTLTGHNDHVGFVYTAASHDSVYAYNRVMRPMGADTPDRMPTPEEWTRINAIRDSLKRIRPDVRDSIFNGADDDGSGTVALIEAARAIAAGKRPARSILFVNHVAEERGLVGSAWFANNPTVERDSIIGDMDMDMIGRGNLRDLPAGGPGYLEVVGARRLSREYGDILEDVNSKEPMPFKFNYEFDAPGHPLQYYCRADHYNYARWSIPAFAVSRGEHADYHQVTDEAEYIDYDALARVANLAVDFARTIANMDHRPKLDAPKADPNTTCRQ